MNILPKRLYNWLQKEKNPILLLLIKFPFSFLKLYFIQLNFMNGFAGFVWSWLSANYSFIKYLKAREIIRNS